MQFPRIISKLKPNNKIEAWLVALLFVATIAFYITIYTAPRRSLILFLITIFLIQFFVIIKLWFEVKSRFNLKVKGNNFTLLSLGYFFLGTFLTTAFLVAEIVTYEVNGVEFFSKSTLRSATEGAPIQWTFVVSKLIVMALLIGVLPAALFYATIIYVLANLIFIKNGRKYTFLNWKSLKRFFVLFMSALIHNVIFAFPIFVIGIFWALGETTFIYTPIIVFPLATLLTGFNYYLAQRMYPWITRYFLTKIQ